MSPSRPPLVSRMRTFGTSVFAEMTRLALAHDAVNLAQGFPDFPGPDFAKEAAVEAIKADRNQYARMAGEAELVQAVAEGLSRRQHMDYDPLSEVTVFSGATEALHCAFLAFCEPGDEVVLLEPTYDSYLGCCALAHAVPRLVTLRAPEFLWDTKELEAAFTPRTRFLLVNTPHNPTGRVLRRSEMEVLADLCRRHDVLCITDEVYERLVYEGEHVPMATLPGMRERTVTINSTAKTFSLTGWKIGYASAPPELSEALRAAHQFVTFATATPLQHAMAAALRAPDSYYAELLREYRERRDFLTKALRGRGFGVAAPEGTFFIMADIRPMGVSDDLAFCRKMVEGAGVAAVPASALYVNKEEGGFLVRFAFCKRMETLREAARRLEGL